MNDYFVSQLKKNFSNMVYITYGKVGFCIERNDGAGAIGFYIYDEPISVINEKTPSEATDHIIFEEVFYVNDVDFNDRYSVIARIDEITGLLEKRLYE